MVTKTLKKWNLDDSMFIQKLNLCVDPKYPYSLYLKLPVKGYQPDKI